MSTENPELCAAGLWPPQSSCGLLPGNTPSKPNLELIFFVDILLCLQNNVLWLILRVFFKLGLIIVLLGWRYVRENEGSGTLYNRKIQ